jgi:hypothetical protein
MTTSYNIKDRIQLNRSNLEINFNQSNTLDASSFVFHQLEDISSTLGPGLLGAVGDISSDTSGTRMIIPAEHKVMILGTASDDVLYTTLSNYVSDTDNSNSPAIFLQVNDNKVEINGKEGIIFDCSEIKIDELTTLTIPSSTNISGTDMSAVSVTYSNDFIYSNNGSNMYVNTLDVGDTATFNNDKITDLSNAISLLESRVGLVAETEFNDLSSYYSNSTLTAYSNASNGSITTNGFGIPKYEYSSISGGNIRNDGGNDYWILNPVGENMYMDLSNDTTLYIPANRKANVNTNGIIDTRIYCRLGGNAEITMISHGSAIAYPDTLTTSPGSLNLLSNSNGFFLGNFNDTNPIKQSTGKLWNYVSISNSITSAEFVRIHLLQYLIGSNNTTNGSNFRTIVQIKETNGNIVTGGYN